MALPTCVGLKDYIYLGVLIAFSIWEYWLGKNKNSGVGSSLEFALIIIGATWWFITRRKKNGN